MTSLAVGGLFNESSEEYCGKNIIRALHNRENPYTLLSNKLLRDTTIRHSDRGLMAQLLSWSDHHHLCIKALVKKSVEGRDAIRGMIDRLIQAGYIRMMQHKSEDGRFDKVVYQIFEESTGAVVADLDLQGIVDDQDDLQHAQLDLFACEIEMFDQNDTPGKKAENMSSSESVKQSAVGKPGSGKPEPNNNYDLRNTNFNNMPGHVVEVETKESLLNKWPLQINDPLVVARLGMAGLQTFITKQDDLDRYLIDFNQQHAKYAHLSHSQRLKNFTAYLVRIKHTPAEYAKHLARLRALGFDVQMPSRKPKALDNRLQNQNVNPFDVAPEAPVQVPELSFEGF